MKRCSASMLVYLRPPTFTDSNFFPSHPTFIQYFMVVTVFCTGRYCCACSGVISVSFSRFVLFISFMDMVLFIPFFFILFLY